MQNLVPANHDLVVLVDDLLQFLIEVSLELTIVFDPMFLLELLDRGIPIPLLAINFVSADMKVPVGKQCGHFLDEVIKKMVSVVACGIHGGIEDAPLALDLIGAGAAGQFGIGNKPTGTVSGHVEFRDYADAAVSRILNDVLDLLL